MMHPAVTDITQTTEKWKGTLETNRVGHYIDMYLLLILGGVPWQVKVAYSAEKCISILAYSIS